jgi:hypothetical protein
VFTGFERQRLAAFLVNDHRGLETFVFVVSEVPTIELDARRTVAVRGEFDGSNLFTSPLT